MKYATKISLIHMTYIALTVLFGLGAGGVTASLATGGEKVNGLWFLLFVVATLAASITFLWLITSKTYACPKCPHGRTKVKNDESDSRYLSCMSCKYSEPAGF